MRDRQGTLRRAVLSEARQSDMPQDWTCEWVTFWARSDFDCEAIIKMEYRNHLMGLIRFAIYPYPCDEPEFVYIHNVESQITQKR